MLGNELHKVNHKLDDDSITVSTIKTTESDRKAALQYLSSLNQARHDARYGQLTKVIDPSSQDAGDYHEMQSGVSSGGGSSRKRIGKQVSFLIFLYLLCLPHDVNDDDGIVCVCVCLLGGSKMVSDERSNQVGRRRTCLLYSSQTTCTSETVS